jgi:hypothetical protein
MMSQKGPDRYQEMRSSAQACTKELLQVSAKYILSLSSDRVYFSIDRLPFPHCLKFASI